MELETCGNSKKVQLWFWGPILAGAKIPPVLRASNRLSLLWRVQQLSFHVVLLISFELVERHHVEAISIPPCLHDQPDGCKSN